MSHQSNLTLCKIIWLIVCLSLISLGMACQARAVSSTTKITTAPTPTVIAPSKFQALGSLSVSADLSAVNKGDNFTVEVVIDTASLIRGVQWSFRFDPSQMRCNSFDEGPFLKDWASQYAGSTLVYPQPVINNRSGAVPDTGIAILAKTTGGASGRGVLGIYHFTALADSPALPRIDAARVAGEKGTISDITIK